MLHKLWENSAGFAFYEAEKGSGFPIFFTSYRSYRFEILVRYRRKLTKAAPMLSI